MSYLPSAVHRMFARQHGVASLDQLLGAGLSTRQIENHVANGALISAIRGAYRSPSVPDTELLRCAEISLARPDVVVGGPTAGRLHGFRRLPPDRRVHVTAPCGANPSTVAPWIRVFHTAAVRPDDVVRRADGIRVFSRSRTAMDLARFLGWSDLRSVVEQAMHDGDHSAIEMIATGADWTNRRRWVRSYLSSILVRIDGPPAESHGELLVGELLRRAGVVGLQRQVPLVAGGRRMRFDLAVPELRWAVEVDLFPTHAETIGADDDRRRDRAAESAGWTVRRVTRSDYEHHLAETVARLAADHAARRAHRRAS